MAVELSGGITLLGLGPGSPDLLTRQAWQVLQDAAQPVAGRPGAGEVYLRTRQHPVVAGFPPGLKLYSFDDLYAQDISFEEVYEQIVEKVLELGRRPQGVIYAVPGHPFIAEATAPEIARRARQEGLPLRLVEGLSFLEPVVSAIGIDPFPHTALVDALELANLHVPPFPTSAPAIVAQIYSPQVASDVKLTLMALYPDEHPVILVHSAGTDHPLVERLPLYQIDRSAHVGLLTALYLPPLGRETGFEAFLGIIAHLRAPNGCPWDREQTLQSLRPSLLEETYEVLGALDENDPPAMREEFGDLLLLIVMLTQIASDEGDFNMAGVLSGIHTKIVHRHPHVFGQVAVNGTQDVLQNWEKLKAQERLANGKSEASLLDGIGKTLPALVQAEQYQKRANHVGFDWTEIEGVWRKVQEELAEVRSAADAEARAAEIGDLLFSVVNLARWYQVDPESALREANLRFRKRFAAIERAARQQGRSLSDLSLDEMDAIWQAAKH
jgi:tetrapyrrole methylase family protein / MazG family protein